jgi:Arc/MetJ-type ribon-helix-helix transcriptional regulator
MYAQSIEASIEGGAVRSARRGALAHDSFVHLQEPLSSLCELGAHASSCEVGRRELVEALETVWLDLSAYHLALEQALPTDASQGRFTSLLCEHVRSVVARQRTQVAALRLSAQSREHTQEVLRAAWTLALELRMDLQNLDHDLTVIAASAAARDAAH